MLEIGCGQGALGVRLAQRYDYVGLEPDQASWAMAERRISAAGRGEVRNIRVDALGPEQFDLVCAFEVLEHIEDDAAAVREWAARLRPGGWLLLSVPAHQRRYGPADELVGQLPPLRSRGHGRAAGQLRAHRHRGAAVRFPARLRAGGGPQPDRAAAGSPRRPRRLRAPSAPRRPAACSSPPAGRGTATRYGTAPFRLLQRGFPGTGTGLVVAARLAADDGAASPAQPADAARVLPT